VLMLMTRVLSRHKTYNESCRILIPATITL
jgi:hypothetical protein